VVSVEIVMKKIVQPRIVDKESPAKTMVVFEGPFK